jgi:hypothetical protein
LYKFVPTTPGVWSSGLLYVLDAPGLAGNGTWRLIPNTTIAQRNATVANSTSAGADNFNGIEDVEIAPDGKIYFAAKGEGKIYRFTDNGTYGTGTDISGLMVFAGNSSYPTITSYDVDGGGPLGSQSWGTGNDNLAFDGEGNLWVLNDGGGGHIWVIAPTHTQASPQVRLFARTPSGSEPTGITFTPDYKFMFLSFQHPAAAGSQTDAAGVSVTFSTHTTVVIARAENLGPFATLPLDFTGFNVKHAGEAVQINWTAANITNHDYFSIERSVDGVRWEEFSRLDDDIDGVDHQSFQVMDNNPPASSIVYYRIKQCDRTGECNYSEIRSLKWSGNDQIVRMYPQPATDQLNISYRSYTEGMVTITIRDMNGKTVQKDTRAIQDGSQTIAVNTSPLRSGVYLVTITDKNFQSSTQKFIKE